MPGLHTTISNNPHERLLLKNNGKRVPAPLPHITTSPFAAASNLSKIFVRWHSCLDGSGPCCCSSHRLQTNCSASLVPNTCLRCSERLHYANHLEMHQSMQHLHRICSIWRHHRSHALLPHGEGCRPMLANHPPM